MPFPITSWRRTHLALVLATILGVAAGYGVSRIHQRPFDMAAAAEPKIPAAAARAPAITPAQLPSATTLPIPVVKPRTQSVSNYVEITGNAASVNAAKLVARVEGYLDKIHYEDGQFVKKGDLLFTVQQDQYKDQLQQAQAQVLAQQAALLYAKTELVRYSKLVKQDAATQTEVDHWNFEKASAEAQLLSA